MDRKTKQRITIQAAFCVEELLETCEKGAKRVPWQVIIERHIKASLLAAKIKPPRVH